MKNISLILGAMLLLVFLNVQAVHATGAGVDVWRGASIMIWDGVFVPAARKIGITLSAAATGTQGVTDLANALQKFYSTSDHLARMVGNSANHPTFANNLQTIGGNIPGIAGRSLSITTGEVRAVADSLMMTVLSQAVMPDTVFSNFIAGLRKGSSETGSTIANKVVDELIAKGLDELHACTVAMSLAERNKTVFGGTGSRLFQDYKKAIED